MPEKDIPLIYTTKGNLPVADLEHRIEWRVTPENIIFIESYLLAGELVKQSSHVHILVGAAAIGDAADI